LPYAYSKIIINQVKRQRSTSYNDCFQSNALVRVDLQSGSSATRIYRCAVRLPSGNNMHLARTTATFTHVVSNVVVADRWQWCILSTPAIGGYAVALTTT